MSEDRPPDGAPDVRDVPDAPDATAPPAATARSRRRLVALTVALVVTAVAALVVHRARSAFEDPGATAAPRGDGRAPIRAPEPPTISPPVPDGARLTGFVVDGAGVPVAGAEVSAELETDVADARPGPPEDGVAQAPPRDAGPPPRARRRSGRGSAGRSMPASGRGCSSAPRPATMGGS